MPGQNSPSNSPRFKSWAVLWIALLAGIMAFSFQGTRGLWDPDEGRYTNVALEMMQSGDYFQPHRHHETLHVTKPPVTYWALAASMKGFGRNEWAARLPMALAFIVTVLLVYQLGKTFSPKRPWLPALIYASSPVPFFAANIITTDTLLAFAETAAVLAFVLYRFDGRTVRYVDLMWALFGLAFMIKGPPGLLPLAAIAAWQWRYGGVKALFRPIGLALFLLVGFTWFFLIIQQKPELLDYFLHHEVVDRVASATHDRNSQWYGGLMVYMPTLLVGALPWLVLALWNRRKSSSPSALQPQTAFLLYWTLLPLAVFMLSRSRLPLYILPLFVPVALLLARPLENLPFRPRQAAWLLLWLVCLLAAKGALAYLPHRQDARDFARRLQPLLPTKPQELVFIDSKASYGLDFYLDTEIEKISIPDLTGTQPISDAEFDQDMKSELFEPERDRYFLVPKNRLPALETFLAENRYTYTALGSIDKFAVLAITPAPGK
ncbi:MAG: glycosyltransferase family 39 protein [Arenimonas sp.]|nr:glycosyltransferase family 39 protein [Arenimonas sp.]